MKILSALVIFGISLNSFANTSCSDSSGSNRYLLTRYEGGMPPPTGTQISDEQIFVEDVLVSESKTFVNKKSLIGPVSASFDQARMQVFENKVTNLGSTKVYGTLMTLNGLSDTSADENIYVICTEILHFYP
jgi:hypothetical protein